MNRELPAFLNYARECAMQMMANATYIKDHLHEVALPADMVPKIEAACESLMATKHDILHEVVEIESLSEESDAAAIPSERVQRIMQWLFEPITELHEIIESLQLAAMRDHLHGPASLLLMESAFNVVNAFNAAGEAADALTKANLPESSHEDMI